MNMNVWSNVELEEYGKKVAETLNLTTYHSGPSKISYVQTEHGRKSLSGLACLLLDLARETKQQNNHER